jgi:hypothetical protein
MSEPYKTRRRWFQYSLRSVLLLMLLVGLGLSWYATRAKRAREQKEAVEEIKQVTDAGLTHLGVLLAP